MPKSKLETPALPPVYFSKDLWYVRIPTTSSSGAQIFRSPTLQGLIEALQRAQWHATWFLREQNARIKTLEAALSHKTELLNKLLQLPKGTSDIPLTR